LQQPQAVQTSPAKTSQQSVNPKIGSTHARKPAIVLHRDGGDGGDFFFFFLCL
jgi:hypothetical protein